MQTNEEKRKRAREYYRKNKKKILKERKEYQQKNKERVREWNRRYRERNKDKIEAYREKNKEKIKKRYKEIYKLAKELNEYEKTVEPEALIKITMAKIEKGEKEK